MKKNRVVKLSEKVKSKARIVKAKIQELLGKEPRQERNRNLLTGPVVRAVNNALTELSSGYEFTKGQMAKVILKVYPDLLKLYNETPAKQRATLYNRAVWSALYRNKELEFKGNSTFIKK